MFVTKEEGIVLLGLTLTEILGPAGLDRIGVRLPPMHKVEGEIKVLNEGRDCGGVLCEDELEPSEVYEC